jgi:hypothetical protein
MTQRRRSAQDRMCLTRVSDCEEAAIRVVRLLLLHFHLPIVWKDAPATPKGDGLVGRSLHAILCPPIMTAAGLLGDGC